MKGGLVVIGLVLAAWGPAAAGELVFTNGSRLEGDLANESLLVSTGSGLVEVAPEDVVLLTREEIRLRDGRLLRGTLVGGRLKARTALGEIAIKVDELDAYRNMSAATSPTAPARDAGAAGTATTEPGPTGAQASRVDPAGLPAVAAYQDAPAASRPATARLANAPSIHPAALRPLERRLEVVGETPLHREALAGSAEIGHVARGQQVTYVDSIDRRLRILNHLVFDGGHWVRVRLADGTEGWVPAERVREIR